ncbi:MAG: heme ABC transporter permease [Pseudomonadota bacterium]
MSIWRYANPAEFMRVTGHLITPVWVAAVVITGVGIAWALFFIPPDYQQGSTVKILYIHVPAALFAINAYFLMAVASVIGLIRRHHVSFLVAKAVAPIGAAFTLVTLVTGAVWGEPMWGTWWAWDARLTSSLIMFFFYLGYMSVWAAIDEPEKAQDLSAITCLVGVVFAVMSRYAVEFWATLHQGASLSVREGQRIDDVFRTPLYVCMAGFFCLFLALLLTRARTEIRLRRARAIRQRDSLQQVEA